VHETCLLLSFLALLQQPKSIIKLINSALDDCNMQVLIQPTTTNNKKQQTQQLCLGTTQEVGSITWSLGI
jgi:hypothetical protein